MTVEYVYSHWIEVFSDSRQESELRIEEVTPTRRAPRRRRQCGGWPQAKQAWRDFLR